MTQDVGPVKKEEKKTVVTHISGKGMFVIATLIMFMISGLYLHYKWHKYYKNASSEAVQLAESLESVLPTQHIYQLTDHISDFNEAVNDLIQTKLLQLVETTNPIHNAYIIAKLDEEIIFLIDSKFSDNLPSDRIYEGADDWVRKPFKTGETVITPPRSDQMGKWINVLVPIKDLNNGEVLAVFGIDFSAHEWYEALWDQMVLDTAVVVIVLILYFTFLYVLFQQSSLRKLNKKLAFDEVLYRSVFDQAPIGIATVNDKNFIYQTDFGQSSVNPMFEKILGRKRSDLSKIKWTDITHPEDLQEDLKKFEQFKKGEIDGYRMEKRFIRPDGSFVWTLMTVSPLLGVYNDQSMHLCLIEDITNQKAVKAALVESEKKYRSITENMSDVVWQMDLNLNTTYISPSVEKLLGESVEEHINKRAEDKFPGRTLKYLQTILGEEMEKEKDRTIDKNRSRMIEIEHYKADGTIVWLELNVSFIRDSMGNAVGLQGASRDITQRKLAEFALEENERRESVLLSHLPGLAYRCRYDRNGTMLIVSDGCYELTGYLPESFINNKDLPFNDIISPEYKEILWAEWERSIPERLPYKCEYEITTAGGQRKWVLEMGQGVYDDNGNVEALEGIILDISDRKEMEIRLRYINEHDSRTGLNNREYLEALLEKDISKRDGKNRALISVDLSTIQLITANYGFHYTQNLIKKAAETLNRYCSDNCLLFQTYENRFVFYIIDYIDENELADLGRKIGDSLESLFVTDRIGGGIGILEIDPNDTKIDIDLLLRRLLIASERSIAVFHKDFGVCFYNQDLEALVDRERDIRKALTDIVIGNTKDKFFVQYQPVLDLKTNTICGFEALARLRTVNLGLVPPGEFIPIAEKTKLIIPIGEKVFINAFDFINGLKKRGYGEISVSVNVSAIQLLDIGFANKLIRLIKERGVNPENIGIEITESVFVSDYEIINSTIDKLRQEGLHIAIDDFGTGYSSLAREKELKVDYLKIDKYFVDQLLDIDLDKVITGDIISMSHKLGHCTVAEGVEHVSQLKYLREHDCDRMQGYLLSRPIDEKDAYEFLEKQVII